jgi:outer membrane receptor protein involved in Fe transport
MKKITLSFLLLSLFWVAVSAQQKGTIKGIITDKQTNETLIGATVVIENTNIGAVTDIDGNYSLTTAIGTYNFVVSYVGFEKLILKNIRIEDGGVVEQNIEMGTSQAALQEVVVTTKVQKQSIGSLMNLQQKSPSFVTGISASDMKRSPDRTTSDVLKRVSGTTIQDNKFVIIRGLADRYNTALINGLALPSTEPDKKAFSFDIFPSNLLDNLIIYKTATPDLPGEFAGGAILLNTKEVPEENFTSFMVGTSYNAQSTFKAANTSFSEKGDWLGLGTDARALPSTFPANFKLITDESEQYAYSKIIPNDWKTQRVASLRPAQNYQFSLARHYEVAGRELGMIGSLSYYNSPKLQFNERNEFNADASQVYAYDDVIYKNNVNTGALLNFSYKLNPLNQIHLNNSIMNNGDDQYIERTGTQLEQNRNDKAYSFFYQSTRLVSNQIIGEHSLPQGKLKAKWGVGHNYINRIVPSYRRMLYSKTADEIDAPYYASFPVGTPSTTYAGRFYSNQTERNFTANSDITIPYMLKGLRSNVKFGGLVDFKKRAFDARNLGYVGRYNPDLYAQPLEQIFQSENIKEGGLRVKEATDKSDSYDANSSLLAGYAMAEHQLSNKLRLVTGVRFESYMQQLSSFLINSPTEVKVNETFNDFMPSLNLTYALNEKSNLRFSASKTVARPNFRELAPFTYYDFLLDASIYGNPELVRSRIINLDAKYELFPGMNQSFAVSAFYKKFDNPIEQVLEPSGAGVKNLQFRNATAANNYGVEVEVRQKLNVLSNVWHQFDNFTWFSNLSYIYSEVDQSNLPGAIVRGLQGQSPYIINSGLTYQNTDADFSATIMYNRIGRRIWAVGLNGYGHTYEAPRNVLDFQLSKKVLKKGEIKLNISDIINNTAVFYQDINESGKFDKGDTKIIGSRFGQNVSLSFGYTF